MSKHNAGEVIAEQGPRIYIRYKGRELAANVTRSSVDNVYVAHLEDGITGEPVELTDGIRKALKKAFIRMPETE